MATVRRRATRAVHLKFGGALRAQGVQGGRPRAGALRAHLLGHRGGAAVRDVFSLEEVPPSLISPLVTGTEPVDPSTYVTFFRPWTQALECTRRGHGRPPARAPRGWPPGAGRTVARPRNCGSWWAATRLRRPATRLDVSCRYARHQPRRGTTRHRMRYQIPVQRFVYETQLTNLPGSPGFPGHLYLLTY